MQIEDKFLLSMARIFNKLALLHFSHVLDATMLIGLMRHARRWDPNVLNGGKRDISLVCRSVVGEENSWSYSIG